MVANKKPKGKEGKGVDVKDPLADILRKVVEKVEQGTLGSVALEGCEALFSVSEAVVRCLYMILHCTWPIIHYFVGVM